MHIITKKQIHSQIFKMLDNARVYQAKLEAIYQACNIWTTVQSERSVPALGFLADELPRDAYTVAAQFLAELGGVAAADEDHGHDLLLRDVVQVAFVRQFLDSVRRVPGEA